MLPATSELYFFQIINSLLILFLNYFRYTCSNGQEVLAKKWKGLTDTLNALGGSNKDHEQWKRFWTDLK